MPSQVWKYFDPDSDATLTEPVEPVMPLDEPPPDGNESLQVRNARITRNQRYEDVYFKLFQVFRGTKRNGPGTTKSTPSLENAFSQR